MWPKKKKKKEKTVHYIVLMYNTPSPKNFWAEKSGKKVYLIITVINPKKAGERKK